MILLRRHFDNERGVVVIWGGVIMKVDNHAGGSDLYLWEMPLDFRGKPKGREFSKGEFIAKSSKFLDPKSYTMQQKVTVAGEITGEELGSYGGLPYVYTVIKIKKIYLWKKEIPTIQWEWGETPYYWPNEISPKLEKP